MNSRSPFMPIVAAALGERRIRRALRRLMMAGATLRGFIMVLPDGEEYRVTGDARTGPTGRRVPPSAMPVEPMHSGLWSITDHLCRQCLGRLVVRMDDGPEAGTYRCTICGCTAAGAIESICACGGRIRENEDLGLRCMPNPKRSFEFPHEITVGRVKVSRSAPDGAQQRALPLRATR